MKNEVKTMWRMGVRDKKDYNKWQWSREYNTFEDLMAASMPYLKANPGRVIRIITRNVYVPITQG